jgi:hypothetical protein
MTFRLAVLVGFLVPLAGCGSSGTASKGGARDNETDRGANGQRTDWTISRETSAMDGARIKVTKDFAFHDRDTLIRAILSCNKNKNDLTISLESYSSSHDGAAAPFVTTMRVNANHQSEMSVDGRVKFGNETPQPIDTVFSLDKYRNVVAWNIRKYALAYAGSIRIDAGHFKDPGLGNPEALSLLGVVMGTQFKQTVTGGQSELNPQLASLWTDEIYDSLFGAGAATRIGAGNYLKARLPMVAELSNDHGTEEIQVPATDANVNIAIEECSVPTSASSVDISGQGSAVSDVAHSGSSDSFQSVAPATGNGTERSSNEIERGQASVDSAIVAPISISVSGRSNPWDQSVNPALIYSAANDAFPPVIVDLAKLAIVSGAEITLKCAGGTTNAGGVPDSGCDGLTMFAPTNDVFQPACNTYYPSKFADKAAYPVYIMQVVGVFATSSGVVVGKPFPVSSKEELVRVPVGATRLQLGMNDCKNFDNGPSPLIIKLYRTSGPAAAPVTAESVNSPARTP